MEPIESLEADLARFEAAYKAGRLTDSMFALRLHSPDAVDAASHVFQGMTALKAVHVAGALSWQDYYAELQHIVGKLREHFPEILRAN